MPTRIRYHAQRKHIIYSLSWSFVNDSSVVDGFDAFVSRHHTTRASLPLSLSPSLPRLQISLHNLAITPHKQLDALLYELHTLSFLLAPSVFVLLCRCITQFQFRRVRELDGRRSLAFWYSFVLLVNLSAVWSHAFDANASGGSAGGGKSIVLDFVGMDHRPTNLQLLLLDATIIFLQTILSTISYETSLALAMPADVPDPLFPPLSSSSTSPSYPYEDSMVFNTERDEEETAPFLPYTTPTSTVTYAPNDRSPPIPPARTSSSTSASTITYPPTPPVPSSSSAQPPEREQDREEDSEPNAWLSTFPKPSPDPLPPPRPVIDLTLRHILHRLTSPIPESSSFGSREGNSGDDVLDEADDELAMLRLPLPNTTTVRVAHAVRIIAQARQRQRQREQREREREQATARRERRRRRSSDGDADADAVDPRTRPREGGGRIPGAIEDEEEEG